MAPKPRARSAARDGDLLGAVGELLDELTRLRIDRPKSAYFYRRDMDLRVDLLFDFPIRAHDVRARSTRKKIRSHVFHIASREDLIRMKEIAARDRRVAGDAEDLKFLRRN